MSVSDSDSLRLTDFLDLPTLQEIQDSFAAVTQVKAVITDAAGNVLTRPTPPAEFLSRQRAIAEAQRLSPAPASGDEGPARESADFIAPIIVNDQRLGTIRMSGDASQPPGSVSETKLAAIAELAGVKIEQARQIAAQLTLEPESRAAAVQLLFLMANAIARLCFQEFQLRQRINELTAVYNVAMALADARDLQKVLERTTRVVCEVMGTKAASIRLVDEQQDELVIKAVYNLSRQYLDKGPVRMSRAGIDKVALSSEGFEYVRDMAADPRVQYPHESVREGIVSMLSVGMRYKGKAIGVLRVYTDHEQRFSPLKIDLLKAVGAQAGAAIENARLFTEVLTGATLEKQVRLAADVQQRMVPQTPPTLPGLDLASVYVPCYTLGGDFYDFIPLPGDNIGLAVADVSGKGVPASLIMASVRAFLRGQVDNVYYLYEVIRRINLMLCRDTAPGEFVTLFYGVLDCHNFRFTYCNAGHPPGLVLRAGEVIELQSDNMVLGVDPDEPYRQAVFNFQKNDLLLLYTDGLTDALSFKGETFGRIRLVEALKRCPDPGADAETIAQHILWEVRKFVGMAPRTDDITMIVGRVR